MSIATKKVKNKWSRFHVAEQPYIMLVSHVLFICINWLLIHFGEAFSSLQMTSYNGELTVVSLKVREYNYTDYMN